MPDKFEIANYLRETGLLLSAKGENQFKARAYLKGARAIEASQADIGKLIKENALTSIPGIGQSLAKTIEEIYKSGESQVLHNLKQEMPEGTIELSTIPGLTLERIKNLSESLGINSIPQLEEALEKGLVREIPGFNARSERALLAKIERIKTRASAILLVDALEIAEELTAYLRSSVRGLSIEVTGDVRRWYEAVEVVQLAAKHPNAIKVLDAFQKFPMVIEIQDTGNDFARVRLANGLIVELFLTDSMPLKLLETTGDAHFRHLQKIARK